MRHVAVTVLLSGCSIGAIAFRPKAASTREETCSESIVPLTADVVVGSLAGAIGVPRVTNATGDGVETIIVGVPALIVAGVAFVSAAIGYGTVSQCRARRARAVPSNVERDCIARRMTVFDEAVLEADVASRSHLLKSSICGQRSETPGVANDLAWVAFGIETAFESTRDSTPTRTGARLDAGLHLTGPLWANTTLVSGTSSQIGAGGNAGPGSDSGPFVLAGGGVQARHCGGLSCVMGSVGGAYFHRTVELGELGNTFIRENGVLVKAGVGVGIGSDEWQLQLALEGYQRYSTVARDGWDQGQGVGFTTSLAYRFRTTAKGKPEPAANLDEAWKLVVEAALAAPSDCSIVIRAAPRIDQLDPALLLRTLLRDVPSARCLADEAMAAVETAKWSQDRGAIAVAHAACDALRVRAKLASGAVPDMRLAERLDKALPRCEVEHFASREICETQRVVRLEQANAATADRAKLLARVPRCHAFTSGTIGARDRVWDLAIEAAIKAAHGDCRPILDAEAVIKTGDLQLYALVYGHPQITSCVQKEAARQQQMTDCAKSRAGALRAAQEIKNLSQRGEALRRILQCMPKE